VTEGASLAVHIHFAAAGSGPPSADGPVAVVVVAGEIDVSSVPKLRESLAHALAPPRREVVVDLAAVEFIDASGVGVLLAAAGDAARTGVKFRLRTPSPSVGRVLQLAQLDGTLEVES
jgi:anti-anti-sigma factor